MNFNTLVEAIAAKVAERIELAECTAEESVVHSLKKSNGSKLLILTQCHGTCCHEMLESNRLAEKFVTECALQQNYECDINDYEALLVYNLNNEVLSKIAAGMCDTPFSALVVQAILAGKKIYVVRNEVELFDYKNTAPVAYYNMMLQKIKLLEDSGVIFCNSNVIEDTILGHTAKCSTATACVFCEKEAKQSQLKKKVITEKDLTAAHADGITVLQIGTKSILTDLARDYAHERSITIVRE